MSDKLQQENKDLRRRLTAVMATAKYNAERMRRFREQELLVLSSSGLVDLLRHVLVGHRQSFGLATALLTLVDPEHEIRRFLHELGCGELFPELRFVDSGAELAAYFGGTLLPKLGPYRAEQHAAMFHQGPTPASVAVLPLLHRRQLIGSLNFGSEEAGRFVAGSATDFLEHLAAVVAVVLESAINHERLKNIGLTDPLTGVHNRRYFDRRLVEEVERAQRSGQPLCCLFIDIDFFKRINDNFGHQVGDRVLQEVAGRIKAQLRLSDALGRYGGEEFAVLLVQTPAEQATEIAERIRSSIAGDAFRLGGDHNLQITISIGVAAYRSSDTPPDNAEWLVSRADQALYRAKEEGRNRVEWHR